VWDCVILGKYFDRLMSLALNKLDTLSGCVCGSDISALSRPVELLVYAFESSCTFEGHLLVWISGFRG